MLCASEAPFAGFSGSHTWLRPRMFSALAVMWEPNGGAIC